MSTPAAARSSSRISPGSAFRHAADRAVEITPRPGRGARSGLALTALAAGAAGGVLAGSRIAHGRPVVPPVRRRRHRGARRALATVGIAGRDAARLAERAGRLESDIRAIRRSLEGERRASPLEVVLHGLTHRPGHSDR